MSLDEVTAQAAQAVAALGGLTRVPRVNHATVTSLAPLQVTYRGELAPFDVSHSYVATPILNAECAVYAEGTDRWLLAQRTTAATVANISGSTINVASFTSSGYSKSGFTSQDTELVAYSEDVIADAVNSNTARIGALEAKVNALLAALRGAGIIA